ncbi:MAG: hypothetical protein ACI9DO_003524 [Reinekea sp.]|jgi:hypothetical protein
MNTGGCYSAYTVILSGTIIVPLQLFVRLYAGLTVIRTMSLFYYVTIYSESIMCTARHAERIKDVSLEALLIVSSVDLSIQWPLTITPEGNSTALICVSGSCGNYTRLAL